MILVMSDTGASSQSSSGSRKDIQTQSQKHVERHEKLRKQVEAELQKRRDAEKGALKTVLSLMEEDITDLQLISLASELSPEFYRDVTEERGLALMCGYPICRNRLRQINHKQKYHISTRHNRVYDVSERKYFCSDRCYKASKYLESQLSSEPLWSRITKPNIVLYSDDNVSGSKMAEDSSLLIDSSDVHATVSKPTKTVDTIDRLDPYDDKELSVPDNRAALDRTQTSDLESSMKKLTTAASDVFDDDKLSDDSDNEVPDTTAAQIIKRRHKQQRLNAPKVSNTPPPPLADLTPAGRDWGGSMLTKTKASANKVRELTTSHATGSQSHTGHQDLPLEYSSKEASEEKPVTSMTPSDISKHMQFALSRLQDWMTVLSWTLINQSASGLPAATATDILVKNASNTSPGSEKLDADRGHESSSVEIAPPNVPTAQLTRRKVVYSHIYKCYESLLPKIGEICDLQLVVKPLVDSFQLNKDNVTARPKEWNYITLVLLYIICSQSSDSREKISYELSSMEDREVTSILNDFVIQHSSGSGCVTK